MSSNKLAYGLRMNAGGRTVFRWDVYVTPFVVGDAMSEITGSVDIRSRLSLLERSLADLEESLDQRMVRLEGEMRSSNAHLDNIARESARTNELLETEIADRREADRQRREWEREDKQRNRTLAVSAGREVWNTFRHPLAYAVMAVATWFAITYLGIQPQQVMGPTSEEVVQP